MEREKLFLFFYFKSGWFIFVQNTWTHTNLVDTLFGGFRAFNWVIIQLKPQSKCQVKNEQKSVLPPEVKMEKNDFVISTYL